MQNLLGKMGVDSKKGELCLRVKGDTLSSVSPEWVAAGDTRWPGPYGVPPISPTSLPFYELT